MAGLPQKRCGNRELANALSIDRFAVLAVSGKGPHALACASEIPKRITRCGIISGMAPFSHVTQQMKPTNETIFLIARKTPWLLRTVLWLGAGRYARSEEAMQKQVRAGLGELPLPDRVLMEDASIERIVVAQAMEAYHRGAKGVAHEGKLLARDWGFPLGDISCENVRLWHGEMDVNVTAEAVRGLAKQITACKAIFHPEEAHLSTMVHHGTEFMAAVRQASATSAR